MTDRPTRWPETPDIVIRLRARREAWTCIREEAASEIEKLRAAVDSSRSGSRSGSWSWSGSRSGENE